MHKTASARCASGFGLRTSTRQRDVVALDLARERTDRDAQHPCRVGLVAPCLLQRAAVCPTLEASTPMRGLRGVEHRQVCLLCVEPVDGDDAVVTALLDAAEREVRDAATGFDVWSILYRELTRSRLARL